MTGGSRQKHVDGARRTEGRVKAGPARKVILESTKASSVGK